MESIVIRNADLADVDKIVEFIRNSYYIKNHVFTRERSLLNDWHIKGDDVWFAIAEGTESKEIYGIMGYTKYSQDICPDVSLAMFQTIKSGDPTLGIRIIEFMEELFPNRCKCSCGMVPKLKGLYTYLGYQVGKLNHYYQLGDLPEYKIARVGNKLIRPVQSEGYTFKQFFSIQEVKTFVSDNIFTHSIPRKDFDYIDRRYFTNIGYDYTVWGVFNFTSQCVALLAGREINCNGGKCFKIVDFIGDDHELKYCHSAFKNAISSNNYEFIDFYEIGISDEIMAEAGFILNDKSENIIPHYFEPYVLENIDIYYCTSETEKFHAYRSDGGQERPNFLNSEGKAYDSFTANTV